MIGHLTYEAVSTAITAVVGSDGSNSPLTAPLPKRIAITTTDGENYDEGCALLRSVVRDVR